MQCCTNDEIEAITGDTNMLLLCDGSGGKVAEADARGVRRGWKVKIPVSRHSSETLRLKNAWQILLLTTFTVFPCLRRWVLRVSHGAVFKETSLEKKVDSGRFTWLQNKTHNSVTGVMDL
ncbi:hypothetical protein PR048_007673 [Dryococelus australis]|uniref:Uncharacterized protein n=1 Tax=Dryococelus australis TaxID=614101 RepID=A0ABQ9HVS9_9NEOP|nr:hypothetical protein PR048_007673 [Dryococelus australis]